MAKSYRDADESTGLGVVAFVIASVLGLAILIGFVSVAINILTA